ncbi:hypothetical protein BaRGS_00003390, partial [Batillaria attramentaria]
MFSRQTVGNEPEYQNCQSAVHGEKLRSPAAHAPLGNWKSTRRAGQNQGRSHERARASLRLVRVQDEAWTVVDTGGRWVVD